MSSRWGAGFYAVYQRERRYQTGVTKELLHTPILRLLQLWAALGVLVAMFIVGISIAHMMSFYGVINPFDRFTYDSQYAAVFFLYLPAVTLIPALLFLNGYSLIFLLVVVTDSIARDRRTKTLENVLTTSISKTSIVLAKWRATLRTLAPLCICLIIVRVGLTFWATLHWERFTLYYRATTQSFELSVLGPPQSIRLEAFVATMLIAASVSLIHIAVIAALGIAISALSFPYRRWLALPAFFATNGLILAAANLNAQNFMEDVLYNVAREWRTLANFTANLLSMVDSSVLLSLNNVYFNLNSIFQPFPYAIVIVVLVTLLLLVRAGALYIAKRLI